MELNAEDLNRYQIIRKDAKDCFVETKSDSFPIGKVHLEFSQYDASRPVGHRQTSHVHIYIDVPEFLHLANEALSGALLQRAKLQRSENNQKALYEHLGGTSSEKLRKYGKPRPDGKSLSRIVKLIWGQKFDYLFIADSGPGETNAKGLIVPKHGNKPENHVSVSLTSQSFNELVLMTQVHYGAWLTAQYMSKPAPQHPETLNSHA